MGPLWSLRGKPVQILQENIQKSKLHAGHQKRNLFCLKSKKTKPHVAYISQKEWQFVHDP